MALPEELQISGKIISGLKPLKTTKYNFHRK